MKHELIILAINGIVNEHILNVVAALGDETKIEALLEYTGEAKNTNAQSDKYHEYMQQAIFIDNPFIETAYTVYTLWHFDKKKVKNTNPKYYPWTDTPWGYEISSPDSPGSDGVRKDFETAFTTTIQALVRTIKHS